MWSATILTFPAFLIYTLEILIQNFPSTYIVFSLWSAPLPRINNSMLYFKMCTTSIVLWKWYLSHQLYNPKNKVVVVLKHAHSRAARAPIFEPEKNPTDHSKSILQTDFFPCKRSLFSRIGCSTNSERNNLKKKKKKKIEYWSHGPTWIVQGAKSLFNGNRQWYNYHLRGAKMDLWKFYIFITSM